MFGRPFDAPCLRIRARAFGVAALTLGLLVSGAWAHTVGTAQKQTAERVAQAGVALSELADGAPDAHTVVRGDTLWTLSRLFLRNPWRWPELWGMNLEQIRNPHLIYPGQVLVLERVDGRARLRVGQVVEGDIAQVRLSPRVRSEALDVAAIAAVPLHLIAPFLNEGVVFETASLTQAPRIVAAADGRVLLTRGDKAYVRGDFKPQRDWQVFRDTRPLRDPVTQEILGHEARFLGSAEFVREGESRRGADGKPEIVPATFVLNSVRQEIGIGDRLTPMPVRDFSSYVPHAPERPIGGHIVSIYGDALTAGQNQIVTLNRGSREGIARGHVLALWTAGVTSVDRTDAARTALRLPDERHGLLFVFRVFERVSYALVLNVRDPVKPGDRFSQP